MRYLVCPCGTKSSVEVAGGRLNLIKLTGFQDIPVSTGGGGDIWVCPSCHEKATVLAKELLSVFSNNPYVSWNCFFEHVQRLKDYEEAAKKN